MRESKLTTPLRSQQAPRRPPVFPAPLFFPPLVFSGSCRRTIHRARLAPSWKRNTSCPLSIPWRPPSRRTSFRAKWAGAFSFIIAPARLSAHAARNLSCSPFSSPLATSSPKKLCHPKRSAPFALRVFLRSEQSAFSSGHFNFQLSTFNL